MEIRVVQSASSVVLLSLKKWRSHTLVKVTLNVGFAISGVTIARLLGTITQILLARMMGVADFGLYTMLYTLLGIVIIVTGLGLDTWLLSQAGNVNTLDTAISQVFSLRFLATTILMLVIIPIILMTNQAGITALLVLLAAMSLTCELLLTTGYNALRAQLRNNISTLLQIGVAVCIPLFIWMLWLNNQGSVLTTVSSRLTADLLGLSLLIWLLRRQLRLIWKPLQLFQIIKHTRIFFVSDILANITLKADLTLVTFFMGALAAGIYNPALVMINTTFLIPGVLWQVLLPIITRQTVEAHLFRRIFGLALLFSVIYGVICAGVFWFTAERAVYLVYGIQYQESSKLIQIMSSIPLLKSINFCWAMLMVASDRQMLRTKLQAIGAIVNIFGNFLLIPLFGLIAAAWINVGTELVLLLCYSYGAWVTLRQ